MGFNREALEKKEKKRKRNALAPPYKIGE